MNNALLFDGLEYWRRIAPQKAALIFDNSEILTYSELGEWSDGLAAHLQSLGVRSGDRVGISGANSIEWVVCAFAALKAGGVLVPFNERFVSDEFAYLIETVDPVVIAADAPRAEILTPLAKRAAMLSLHDIASFKTGAPAGWKPARVESTSVGMIIFTSGTTGRPKGVMYGHEENISNYLELGLVIAGIGPETVHLMTVSIQSAVGTAWGFLFTTTVGGSFCFMRKFDPRMALEILVDRRVSFFPCFPLVLEQIARQPEFDEADLSSLSMASAGGARVEAALLERWRNKGVLLRQMYGQTEVGGFATIGTDLEAREGRLSCGRPMIFTQIRIVDPDSLNCAERDQPGEIWVKGPGAMLGYWRDPEATAKTVVDGWIRTGDLGAIDGEGYLTFVDRMKDMIITGGFNVSPSEVEAIISQIEGVLEVSVIPVPDERFGETPAAIVYSASQVSPDTVFKICKAKMAGFKVPRYVISVEQPLPRIPNGKIAKRVLIAEYADAPTRFPKMG